MSDLPVSPPAQFEGGCAFVDGAYVPLTEAKISMFDLGFTRSDATCDVVRKERSNGASGVVCRPPLAKDAPLAW